MNKSKDLSNLIMAFLLIFSFVGCGRGEIALPSASDLKSIVLSEVAEGNNTCITITGEKEIKNIIDSIKLNAKKTSRESVSDEPTDTASYINLEFNFSTEGSSIAYVYKIENRYYIEQSYSGIWEITKESYDNIETLLQDK